MLQNNKEQGFTLIELIIVIVLLGILAVAASAKFNNLTEDAYQAKVKANASALKSGIDLARAKWLILGSPTSFSARNDVQVFGDQPSGTIDFNIQGWPAQTWTGSDSWLATNNNYDCLTLWSTLIQDGSDKAAFDNSAEFIVAYEGNETCSYKLTKNTSYGFIYDTRTGEVTLTF